MLISKDDMDLDDGSEKCVANEIDNKLETSTKSMTIMELLWKK